MTTESEKSDLLEDFKNYLQQSTLEPFSSTEQPDLNSLLSEMTELKTEVKMHSRHFKSSLDSLSSALLTVEEDNKVLSKELTATNQRLKQQQTEFTRTMLLEILDIYDNVGSGLDVLQNYRPIISLLKRSRKRDVKFIQRMKQGQQMTDRRFQKLLQEYHVNPIECIGKFLDPVTMRAVETGVNPNLENGIVLDEYRKGYMFDNKLLRLAEVKVNKINIK